MDVIAAALFGHDNGCYMVASTERRLPDVPDEVFCPECGWKRNWAFTRPDFVLGRRRMDVSSTLDHCTIVSERVRDIFLSHRVAESDFSELREEPGFYQVIPTRCVEFDVARRRTRFGAFCSACGLHETVAGATPVYLKGHPGDGHLFRTDVLFGSYNERSPLIIVSESLFHALRGERLSGLVLESVDAQNVGGVN